MKTIDDTEGRTEVEALIAEKAVLAFRESCRAMRAAPHGHGLRVTEAAVQREGFKLVNAIMQECVNEAQRAEKKGAPSPAGAEAKRGSSTSPTAR